MGLLLAFPSLLLFKQFQIWMTTQSNRGSDGSKPLNGPLESRQETGLEFSTNLDFSVWDWWKMPGSRHTEECKHLPFNVHWVFSSHTEVLNQVCSSAEAADCTNRTLSNLSVPWARLEMFVSPCVCVFVIMCFCPCVSKASTWERRIHY